MAVRNPIAYALVLTMALLPVAGGAAGGAWLVVVSFLLACVTAGSAVVVSVVVGGWTVRRARIFASLVVGVVGIPLVLSESFSDVAHRLTVGGTLGGLAGILVGVAILHARSLKHRSPPV